MPANGVAVRGKEELLYEKNNRIVTCSRNDLLLGSLYFQRG